MDAGSTLSGLWQFTPGQRKAGREELAGAGRQKWSSCMAPRSSGQRRRWAEQRRWGSSCPHASSRRPATLRSRRPQGQHQTPGRQPHRSPASSGLRGRPLAHGSIHVQLLSVLRPPFPFQTGSLSSATVTTARASPKGTAPPPRPLQRGQPNSH